MKNFFRTLPQRLLWMFAGVGISNLAGIPFVGRIAALGLQSLSDGLQAASNGAESLSQYMTYENQQEAHRAMMVQIAHGARVEQIYTYGDGSMGVRWDIQDYVGDDLSLTVSDEVLQADWF